MIVGGQERCYVVTSGLCLQKDGAASAGKFQASQPRGEMWGLIDPVSHCKEDLSCYIPITRDVYIPCNRNKSDQNIYFWGKTYQTKINKVK